MTTATAPKELSLNLMPGPQAGFVLSEARYPGYFGGRGAGKTTALVDKGMLRRLRYPGSMGCFTEPTFAQVRDILMPSIRQHFGSVEGHLWEFARGDMEIRFKNGSVQLLRPADAFESIRGLNLLDFGADEVCQGRQEETFMLLQGCLRQQGFGNIHQGFVASTPKGLRHWTAFRWKQNRLPNGQILPAEDYPIFQARTKENYHLDGEFHKNLSTSYGTDTKFAQQELEGEFVVFEGQAFPQFDERIHVRPFPMDVTPKRMIRGLDWGAVSPTASHMLNLMPDNRIWITNEVYKRRMDQRELVEALPDGKKVYCDPNAKDVIDFLRRNGVPAFKARSNDFALRYRLVSARLALGPDGLPGMYIDPSCINLIEEVQTLSFAKPRGMDMLTDKWEQGLDDHAVDDVAYALMELDAGPLGKPTPSVNFSLAGLGARRWGHT